MPTNSKRKPGPKFNKTDREQAIARCVDLAHQGWTQYMIAAELGVSRNTVADYLDTAKRRWQEQVAGVKTEEANRILSEIEWIRREVTAAWHRSKEDKESLTQERSPQVVKVLDGKSKEPTHKTITRIKEILTKEGRLPACEYMNIYLKTVEIKRDLFGLKGEDAPDVLLMQVNTGGQQGPAFDWEPLTERRGVTDPAERAIAALPPPKVIDAEVVDAESR